MLFSVLLCSALLCSAVIFLIYLLPHFTIYQSILTFLSTTLHYTTRLDSTLSFIVPPPKSFFRIVPIEITWLLYWVKWTLKNLHSHFPDFLYSFCNWILITFNILSISNITVSDMSNWYYFVKVIEGVISNLSILLILSSFIFPF